MIHWLHSSVRKLILSCLLGALTTGCSSDGGGDGGGSDAAAVVAYCPYLPSKTFSSSVTVSGTALYEYRSNGNGYATNGTFYFKKADGTSPPYTLTIDGIQVSSSSVLNSAITSDLTTAINSTGATSALVTAENTTDYFGDAVVKITPKLSNQTIEIVNTTNNLSQSGGNPNPIRHAEVRVVSSAGALVQCAETGANGAFSFTLPSNSGSYTVYVTSRSSNARNTAYVLNTPSANQYHSISTTVSTTSNTVGLRLVAKATSSKIEGAAFNILDQILNAQEYLRARTSHCGDSGDPTYFSGCLPFTVAPLVTVYWAPGVNPAEYVGSSSPVSFYIADERELYILGGVEGDTNSADMDHFDNSVIIHEYGHFIEDQYGNPDSPGGSHNGNAVIDPRLAWGEGWANFFQAAVLDNPVYRDTYGHVDCGIDCTGAWFGGDIDMDPSGTPAMDATTDVGEGNFREFSVARLLWDAIKDSGGPVSPFSELWTALNGNSNSNFNSMRTVSDPFKSIGRFHYSQDNIASNTDWSSLRVAEDQTLGFVDYATRLKTSGCPSSIEFNPWRPSEADGAGIIQGGFDSGEFSTSDQLRNNDFYYYQHGGGTLTLSLTWSGGDAVDLDLYLYKEGYVFGQGSTMAAYSYETSLVASGSETVSKSIPAGQYLINVNAYTGQYSGVGTVNHTTYYVLKVNGTVMCPQ